MKHNISNPCQCSKWKKKEENCTTAVNSQAAATHHEEHFKEEEEHSTGIEKWRSKSSSESMHTLKPVEDGESSEGTESRGGIYRKKEKEKQFTLANKLH